MDIVVGAIGALVLAQFIDGRVAFVLVVLAVIGRRVVLRRRRLAEIKKLGLAPEDLELMSQYLQRGDRDAAIERIAGVQERHRTELRSRGLDVDAITPEFGRDIQWTDIIRHVFRVLEFDRAGTTIEAGNTVKPASAVAPYGYLLVESPILNQRARLPIIHRDDFLLAASVFDDPTLSHVVTDAELLVTYVPKHKLPGGLAGVTHALHYVIVPPGTLDRYYEVGGDIHMAKPAPQKLLGHFVYDGDIRVQVNRDPQF